MDIDAPPHPQENAGIHALQVQYSAMSACQHD